MASMALQSGRLTVPLARRLPLTIRSSKLVYNSIGRTHIHSRIQYPYYCSKDFRFVALSMISTYYGASKLVSKRQYGSCTCSDIESSLGETDENSNDKDSSQVLLLPKKSNGVLHDIFHRLRALLKYMYTFIQVSIRGLDICARCSPLLILIPAGYFERSTMRLLINKKSETPGFLEELSWSYFFNMVQSLGPVFIKLGQVSSFLSIIDKIKIPNFIALGLVGSNSTRFV